MNFLSERGVERLWAHILVRLGGKVDKISGKSLSTNDYTDEDKNSLSDAVNKVNELDALVGDTAVSEQISDAMTNVLYKTPQELTSEELVQVRSNLRFIGEDLEGRTFTVNGQTYTASPNAERFGDYENNIAIGQWSIAEGRFTIAGSPAQHVEGTANIEDTASKYIHIAGNGEFTRRSNAYTLDWNGIGWYAGGIKIGGTGQDDTEAQEVVTTGYVISVDEIDAICGMV